MFLDWVMSTLIDYAPLGVLIFSAYVIVNLSLRSKDEIMCGNFFDDELNLPY